MTEPNDPNEKDRDLSSDRLLATLYTELRSLARAKMAHVPPGQTLQATVLVHEAYLRLRDGGAAEWNSKGHFLAAAATAMRRILIEQARAKQRVKRGGDRDRVTLSELAISPGQPEDDVLAVHEAVERLEAQDPRKGQIVNLRYFGGLTNTETAEAMELSVGTVEREWRFIKAWLRSELTESD